MFPNKRKTPAYTARLLSQREQLNTRREQISRQLEAAQAQDDIGGYRQHRNELDRLENEIAMIDRMTGAAQRMQQAQSDIKALQQREADTAAALERGQADLARLTARLQELESQREQISHQAATELLEGRAITPPPAGLEFEYQATRDAINQLEQRQAERHSEQTELPNQIHAARQAFKSARRFATQLEVHNAMDELMPLIARAAWALYENVGVSSPTEYHIDISSDLLQQAKTALADELP